MTACYDSSTVTPILQGDNLVILVTGGASGLGLGTVRRFAKGGGKVVICDLPNSNGLQIAKELGDCVIFVPTDVTSEDDVTRALQVTNEQFGMLHVVVNCAGVMFIQPLYDAETDTPHSLDSFRRIIDVNTVGTFNVTRLAVQMMSRNPPNCDGQRGVIVNVSSVHVASSGAQKCAYVASKCAVSGMSLCLARETSGLGIRCVAIAPGLMDTPLPSPSNKKLYSVLTPCPRRAGRADEFAHLVQCIVENPFINGTDIKLDGGLRVNFP